MIDYLLILEQSVIDSFHWPSWALRLICLLSTLVLLLIFLLQLLTWSKSSDSKSTTVPITYEFRFFQFQYLSVYLITMLADWLQGTNMYTLYASYGVNIGALFLTGFLSSAIFGTFLGIYVDRAGRKLGCIIFCLLEIVINTLEHVPNIWVLLIGRVLGGLSTSLLFTTFESWMVSEHHKKGFDESLLASTFSISSAGNGIMAILAGILAQRSSDISGDIGPFQLAILLTVVTLVFIFFWNENYGTSQEKKTNEEEKSLFVSFQHSINIIRKHPKILFLGLSQAFYEGAIFIFVFLWVPSMLKTYPLGTLPLGLIFSCFMLSMTLGGVLFSFLLTLFPKGVEVITLSVYLLSAVFMLIPIINFDFWYLLVSFLLLEGFLGVFNSCGGTLRSLIYPEHLHSSIMSVFRIILNALVVIGTLLANSANDESSIKHIFGGLVVLHLIAFILQLGLMFYSDKDPIKED